jgi:hypothetical protein
MDLRENSISCGFSVERPNALFLAMAHNKEYFGPISTNETSPVHEIEVVGKKGTTSNHLPRAAAPEVPPRQIPYNNNEAMGKPGASGRTLPHPALVAEPSAYIDQYWKHMPIRFHDAKTRRTTGDNVATPCWNC